MADDLATFRAAHPSVKEAIEKCERPDWALQLAYEASRDRMGTLRIGIDIARFIKGSNMGPALFTPLPTPYEALDRWSKNDDDLSGVLSNARAFITGTIAAILLAFVIDRYVTSTWSLLAMFLVLALVLAVVIRLTLAAVVRLQAARLDEKAALERIVRLIEQGARKHPKRAVRSMRFFRSLAELID